MKEMKMPESKKMCHGVVVPMVTPVTDEGRIDEASAGRLAEFIVENNCFPFILGTTGEAALLDEEEKRKLVRVVCGRVGDKTQVYAGISHNSVRCVIEDARDFFDMGISVAVSHLPSYYSLTPDQMFGFFEMVADRSPGPLVIYNITATTHMSIPLDVIDRLSRHERIVGTKDSERDAERMEKAVSMWKDREDFSHLLGWNAMMARALEMGTDGIVPSTGNVAPYLYDQMIEAVSQGDLDRLRLVQEKTDEISRIYQTDRTLGGSLAAMKVILNWMGICGPAVLPPLNSLSEEEAGAVRQQAASCQWIKRDM
jgi:4-hydroxy-tetrahydrodipicolinate synthase